jgi:2'-5' RNA ligase
MPEQFSLAGIGSPPQPTDRLFFAIFPDPPVAARIAQLAQRLHGEHGFKGKPLGAERFHITLHHVGNYAGLPPDIVAAAIEAATTVGMPSFEVAFDRALSFTGKPGNRPFVLRGGESMLPFQQALLTVINKTQAASRTKSPFTPHVTLLYDDRIVAEHPIETVAWTVREFVLVHSLLGRTVHVPLARWRLRA